MYFYLIFTGDKKPINKSQVLLKYILVILELLDF